MSQCSGPEAEAYMCGKQELVGLVERESGRQLVRCLKADPVESFTLCSGV